MLRPCRPRTRRGTGISLETSPAVGDLSFTRDLAEAASLLGDSYAQLTIRAPRNGSEFGMGLNTIDVGRARVTTLAISTSVVSTVALPMYIVALPRSGTARAVVDDETTLIGPTSGLVVSAGTRARVDYASEHCEVLTVQLFPDDVEAELSAMLDRNVSGPILFGPDLDLTRRDGPIHRLTESFVDEVLTADGELHRHLVLDRFVRLLAAKLLLIHPHNHSDELARRSAYGGPGVVRDASALIDADPMAFVTVADIARAVNVSVRTLEDAFNRSRGTAPMAALRDARLRRAYEALSDADPATSTATAIAQEWGFFHYGRFARDFRQRFGRTPAEVLRDR